MEEADLLSRLFSIEASTPGQLPESPTQGAQGRGVLGAHRPFGNAGSTVSGTALGVMGGTFDPIHCGHVALALAVSERLGLDGMLFIPAGIPSFKRDRSIASGDDRLAMVRLAIAACPWSAVSDREVRRPGVTYAVDTLRELKRDCPASTRLVYVMGADTLATLPQWRSAREVAELCEVAVAARPGAMEIERARLAVEQSGLPVRLHCVEAALPEVSSTEVRGLLHQGVLPEGLVPPAVLGYIAAHRLYGFATKGDSHGPQHG